MTNHERSELLGRAIDDMVWLDEWKALETALDAAEQRGVKACIDSLRADALAYDESSAKARTQNRSAGIYYARTANERRDAADELERTLLTEARKDEPCDDPACNRKPAEPHVHGGPGSDRRFGRFLP